MTPLTPHSITEMNRLRDRAHAEADTLRSEAIQDFWRGANYVRLSAMGQAERAARRLAARLTRRRAVLRCPKSAGASP